MISESIVTSCEETVLSSIENYMEDSELPMALEDKKLHATTAAGANGAGKMIMTGKSVH